MSPHSVGEQVRLSPELQGLCASAHDGSGPRPPTEAAHLEQRGALHAPCMASRSRRDPLFCDSDYRNDTSIGLLGKTEGSFQSGVGDCKKAINLVRSSADASPPYGFMLLPGTTSSGFAMKLSSFSMSHTKSAPFIALE